MAVGDNTRSYYALLGQLAQRSQQPGGLLGMPSYIQRGLGNIHNSPSYGFLSNPQPAPTPDPTPNPTPEPSGVLASSGSTQQPSNDIWALNRGAANNTGTQFTINGQQGQLIYKPANAQVDGFFSDGQPYQIQNGIKRGLPGWFNYK